MVFVAHSLGCLVVAEWANERTDPSVTAAFMVAAPDPDGDAFPPGGGGFGMATKTALSFPTMMVASRDDPYASFDYARDLAETWGSELVDIGARGHINAASGLGEWEEGWSLLEAFLQRQKARP